MQTLQAKNFCNCVAFGHRKVPVTVKTESTCLSRWKSSLTDAEVVHEDISLFHLAVEMLLGRRLSRASR